MTRAVAAILVSLACAALVHAQATAKVPSAVAPARTAPVAPGERRAPVAPTAASAPVVTKAEKDGVAAERTLAARGAWQPGTPIAWTLRVTVPAGWSVAFTPLGDALGPFDVHDAKSEAAAPGAPAVQRATIYGWEAGELEVPASTVTATGPGDTRVELQVPAAKVRLESWLADGQPLTELPADIRAPVSIPDYRLLVLAVSGVSGGGLVALVWWWLRGRRTAVPEAPPLPPGEWAMREMDRLEQDRLPERGDVEGFFVRLSDVVRAYVERRFSIAAPDRTTQEFLREAARDPALAGEHERTLGAFLRAADMVKFAAARPGTDACAESLAAMRGFVDRTAATPETVPPTAVDGAADAPIALPPAQEPVR